MKISKTLHPTPHTPPPTKHFFSRPELIVVVGKAHLKINLGRICKLLPIRP
ncbi:MAG: hypothetical protein O9332_07110 [Microcystis sp. LE19-10.1B]|uniref:hypothetical protein n=1 Tax=Microcystis sp. LE19-10.1B TaxID=3016428 RepID=UPI0022BCF645|nr:hypothetical protein [Microcystis sp. LE19-10.1B]MCZ8025211.1 hypothetical protein [Microcystis sp. LE19-10.1B]